MADVKAAIPYIAAAVAFGTLQAQVSLMPSLMESERDVLEQRLGQVEEALVRDLRRSVEANADDIEEHEDTLNWLLRWVTGWESQYPDHATRLRALLGSTP